MDQSSTESRSPRQQDPPTFPSAVSASTSFDYCITDLIPLERLQRFQDTFAIANQVASTLVSIDGVPITRPSNHSPICAMVRETAKGLQNCVFSGRILSNQAHQESGVVQHKCRGVGFIDGAAPIIVSGHHIATWLIGQYATGDVDEERLISYSQELGIDPQRMLKAFNEMPRMEQPTFDAKLQLLELVANELSMLAFLNLTTRTQARQLEQTRSMLEEYQVRLEQKVKDRTFELNKANERLEDEIRTKSKIERRQHRWITAIEHTVDSIIVTTTGGRIIYVNPAFERLTGYSFSEVIGKTPRILNSGILPQDFFHKLWQTIRKGEVWSGRLVNRKKNGELFHDETTISPVLEQTGKIRSFVAVKRDITKELELTGQLERAKRLESVGILAAGVAHEINTPVQYLLNNTQFIEEAFTDIDSVLQQVDEVRRRLAAGDDPDEVWGAFDRLREETELAELLSETGQAIQQNRHGLKRISTIVKALRDFADPGNPDKALTDLNALIDSAVIVSRNAWESKARMVCTLEPHLPQVPLLASEINQVLFDMIINAVQAIEEKNEKEKTPEQRGTITITTRNADDCVELRISDSGCGISPDIEEKIFNPFFTTRKLGHGLGKGLAAIHTIISELHGGSIQFSPNPGTGACFTISLPKS